ncbi:MAG: sigma-70 family RNA polymerase sigma factor [Acidobacteriota bacterium]|nr:sigma-70 family RNA polymerase sigma factor [Acidobacteriota bacterium]
MVKPLTAAGGREAEFESEALPHLDDLYRMAVRMTGDRSRAEDAVQEAYLQAWKSFHKFEKGTNCKAWLYRILFYTVHHQRRKLFRFPAANEAEESIENTLAAPEPVAEVLRDEDILKALDSIPEDYRSAILLVDVEEFAYKEAAQILRVPIGTVMSRLNRGRAQLRRRLAGIAR